MYYEIIEKRYQPLLAKVFVIRSPIDREVFAPIFRDRVVRHLVYRYIYDFLDSKFIYDSYSCRIRRGILFGIDRAKKFLRKVSDGYTEDAYVLKFDISQYFININRNILYQQVENLLDYDELNITNTEKEILSYLIKSYVCMILL